MQTHTNTLLAQLAPDWATLRVPQMRFFAFRSYFDMRWKFVDLARLDLRRELVLPLPHQGSATPQSLGMADMTDVVNGGAAQDSAVKRSFLQRPQAGDESAFLQEPLVPSSGREEI